MTTAVPTTVQSPVPNPAPNPAPRVHDERPESAARPRGWAWAGVAAAVAAITGSAGSLASSAVYDETLAGDAPAIVELMSQQIPQLLVFHLGTMTAVALLPVLAVGLFRRLRGSVPTDSLLPGVAAIGLVLVAVVGLMGTALNTEFIFGLTDPALLVPETAVMYGHWVGTVQGCWVGAGIAGVAVGLASFRHRAVPRWLGVVGLVLGGLTLLLGISPLQYMAGMTGPVWLLVTALGFALGDRRPRATA